MSSAPCFGVCGLLGSWLYQQRASSQMEIWRSSKHDIQDAVVPLTVHRTKTEIHLFRHRLTYLTNVLKDTHYINVKKINVFLTLCHSYLVHPQSGFKFGISGSNCNITDPPSWLRQRASTCSDILFWIQVKSFRLKFLSSSRIFRKSFCILANLSYRSTASTREDLKYIYTGNKPPWRR